MKKITETARQLFALLKKDPIKDRQELISVGMAYAVSQAKRDALTQQMDAEILAVRDKYAHRIEQEDAEIDNHFKRIKAWAVANRAEEFSGQTLIIAGHTLEFRQSPGAVKIADGFKEEDIVEQILALPTNVTEWEAMTGGTPPANQSLEEWFAANDLLKESLLRVKAEIEKNAVKREWRASAEQPERRARLAELHLQVVTDESFSFTPARVEIPSITTKEAA
jgi:phage host-nuclease inhibitor protein Gam